MDTICINVVLFLYRSILSMVFIAPIIGPATLIFQAPNTPSRPAAAAGMLATTSTPSSIYFTISL
ncbi:MAG: hypothetical protein OEZ02_08030 [Anaerolineae bacterium]|nr:hypothetical protein [Anaerolineae bacterium]